MVHQNDNIVNERRPTTKNANEFNQINDSAAAAAAAVVAVASIVTISPSLSPSPSLLLLLNKFMTTMMITTTIDAIKVQNQIKKVRTLSIVLLLILDICFPPCIIKLLSSSRLPLAVTSCSITEYLLPLRY